MGFFDKGEKAGEGIRRALEKRGFKGNVYTSKKMADVFINDIGCAGTQLQILWMKNELEVTFFLGTNPLLYSRGKAFVDKYNQIGAFSRAYLCDASCISDLECNKIWIESFMISDAKVKADAEVVEFFTDLVLEDIFDTHKDILEQFFADLK